MGRFKDFFSELSTGVLLNTTLDYFMVLRNGALKKYPISSIKNGSAGGQIIQFGTNPTDGQTIKVNEQTVTFMTTPVGFLKVQIGPDLTSSIDNAVSVLSKSNNSAITAAIYSNVDGTGIQAIASTKGSSGNNISLRAGTADTDDPGFFQGGEDPLTLAQALQRVPFDELYTQSRIPIFISATPRIVPLECTGGGTLGSTITIGDLVGIVGTDIVGSYASGASQFATAIGNWLSVNRYAIDINAGRRPIVVLPTSTTITIEFEPGARANSLEISTDDPALIITPPGFIISGAGAPPFNGFYTQRADVGGKPSFNLEGESDGTNNGCRWDPSSGIFGLGNWYIQGDGLSTPYSAALYGSYDDVPNPILARFIQDPDTGGLNKNLNLEPPPTLTAVSTGTDAIVKYTYKDNIVHGLIDHSESGEPIDGDKFIFQSQAVSRVVRGTCSGTGTLFNVIHINALSGVIGAAITIGSDATTFAANIVSWFNTDDNLYLAGLLSVVDNLDATFTLIFKPGFDYAADVDLPSYTSDPDLIFSEDISGKDKSVKSCSIGSIRGYIRSFLLNDSSYFNTDARTPTGLTSDVEAGGVYKIELELTISIAGESLQFDFDGGTATFIDFRGQWLEFKTGASPTDGDRVVRSATVSSETDIYQQASTDDVTYIRFVGTLECDHAGSITLQAAQISSSFTSSAINRYSSMILTKMN